MEKELESVLKSIPLKITGPRIHLLRELLSLDEFVDAETLWLRLKEKGEKISFATTYFNLALFFKHGLVQQKGEGKARGMFKLHPAVQIELD